MVRDTQGTIGKKESNRRETSSSHHITQKEELYTSFANLFCDFFSQERM